MASPSAASRPGVGRSVVAANGAVAVALIILIAAVALVVKPPAPPGIAEFAPQASKPITKAPQSQSSSSGSGKGACLTTTCPSPKPSARPTPHPSASAAAASDVGAPSALQCFTWPDGAVTQTFDPQSPPCIATWPSQPKGNGGSTSTGVTPTAVRIAVPALASGSALPGWQPFVDFINTHYELYGRQIQLVPFTSQQLGDDTYEDPSAQHADAVSAGGTRSFAALDFLDSDATFTTTTTTLPDYVNQLAREHVISVAGGYYGSSLTDAQMAQQAPYAWSYLPTIANLLNQTAILACRQLVGHLASHSSRYASKTRSFGLVLPDAGSEGGPIPGLSTALSTLAGCGVSNPPIVYFSDSGSGPSTAATEGIAKLKSDGITTVLFLPATDTTNSPLGTANSEQYDPEWLIACDEALECANISNEPKAEKSDAIGVTVDNKLLPLSETPWFIAEQQTGAQPSTSASMASADAAYRELQLIASGIQMAGPDLTPASFAAALHGTQFPNPGSGQAPSYQGRVDFAGSATSMVQDFAGWWPDPSSNEASVTEEGETQAADDWQSMCWLNLGTRFATSWPTRDTFRTGSCR